MFRDSFKRFFPTPNFLRPHSFGLDISDESVKFAELIPIRGGVKMGRHGERKIPPGIIQSGRIKDQDKLEEILLSLKKDFNLKSVRVSLPEEQIYLFELRLEKEGVKRVREAIELSLEEHIPVPAEDTVFDYEILNEDDKFLELEVGAIQGTVLKSYLAVFENSRMLVESCELEAQAIARAVIKKGDMETYMIVDFGQTRTGIFIISRGVVVFTSTFSLGGESLVEMIQKSLNVSHDEALKLKIDYGLARHATKPELFPAILNIVSVLRDEIAKHFLYWHTHKNEAGQAYPPIKKIILCGGESNLIGLPEYISVSLKTEVELGNVWTNIIDPTKSVPEMSFRQSLSFATVFGLAFGDFEHD
jgi:type IV pilus assembly protein PilM